MHFGHEILIRICTVCVDSPCSWFPQVEIKYTEFIKSPGQKIFSLTIFMTLLVQILDVCVDNYRMTIDMSAAIQILDNKINAVLPKR